MSEAWELQTVPLGCRISDFTLFAIRRRLLVRSVPLSADAGPSDGALPNVDALAAGQHGFLVRSAPVEGPLPRIAVTGGFLRYVRSQYSRYYIDLTGTEEDYLAKFSSKSRSTLRRKMRRFADLGGGTIDWREYRTPEELRAFHQVARHLSRRTYQERLLDAGLPDTGAFVEEMTALAAEDRARGYLLFLDDEPVSYLYCPVREGVLAYAYLGYHPEYAKHSPGTVLQWLAVQKLFREGQFRLFDFTEGQGDHKRFFATGSRSCADLLYLKRGPWNIIVLGLLWLCDTGSEVTGLLLERLGLKARIRHLIRRG